MSLEVKCIEWGTKDYEQMLELRKTVLLQPIGVPFSYIVPENEKADFLIAAFEGSRMTGCCVLSPRTNGAIQLRQMAVDNRLQQKGVGRMIVHFAEQVARQNNYQLLYMHARNTVMEFYAKCGYSIDGPEFEEVGIKHHRMQKKLGVVG